MKEKLEFIEVQNVTISLKRVKDIDYISLTDLAKQRNPQEPRFVIQNWLKSQPTIGFLSVWEEFNNPNFNRMQMHTVKEESFENAFTMTPKRWIKEMNAIGISSSSGRYGGGTYAHLEIAMEFASWLSPEFKYYVIKEYQRLKQVEIAHQSLEWNLSRTLSKINYRIHTDAVKEFLIPPELTPEQASFKYAEEVDVLNMALFGKTAKQWRDEHPEDAKVGNMRDFAPLEHLIVLSNLESINAMLITDEMSQKERLLKLNKTAITQLKSLYADSRISKLQNQSAMKQIQS